MPHRYERSIRPKSSHIGHHRTDDPTEPTTVGLSEDVPEYETCPRPHCGGVIVSRSTITESGSCEELICVACSRVRLVSFREPYTPVKMERKAVEEELLSPRAEPAGRGTGLDEVECSAEVLHVVRRS